MGCVCSKRKDLDVEVNIAEELQKKKNESPEENMIKQKEESKEKEDSKSKEKIKCAVMLDSKNPENGDLDQEKQTQKNCINNEKRVEILSKDDNQYNYRVFELINQIRTNPPQYAETVIDNIKNITKETHKTRNKKTGVEEDEEYLVFKKKVKVLLFKGEECFRDTAKLLENTQPMSELKYSPDIVIPLPDSETEMRNPSFIKRKVNDIRANYSINAYFKDYIKNPEVAVLLMIVDDTENFNGKKREALLNPNLKYIGIDSKFIGKLFIAHFSFSK